MPDKTYLTDEQKEQIRDEIIKIKQVVVDYIYERGEDDSTSSISDSLHNIWINIFETEILPDPEPSRSLSNDF